MAEISRSDLFAKLTPLAFKTLESATMFCKLRGHQTVELTHWLIQILQLQDADLQRLIREFGLNESRLSSDLTDALERLPRGGASVTDLSAHVEEAVERGWLYASLLFHSQQVRTGHLVVSMLKTPALRNYLLSVSAEFSKFKLERLTDQFDELLSGSPETPSSHAAPSSSSNPGSHHSQSPAAMGGTAGLDKFTTDLTAAARNGRLDPVVGRNAEIRQVVDILMRRRQNNPILTGEAGVGKTAVVEGLALRIAAGDVPPSLSNVRLLALDVGLLQAGASLKGEFEQRLRQVIDEVQASPTPIILFIDEAHTLLGGGSQAGPADAANLLKPALARGNLRTIAATTWSEYKKYIEKDPALTRRFQVIKVDQPAIASAINMLRYLTDVLQQHHHVRILDEAVRAAVELSSRYIPDRQLPDKAISLLDTAAARVAVSQHAVPAEVDDCRKQIESLQVEAAIVRREITADQSRANELSSLESAMASMRETLAGLESRWEQERQLVQTMLGMQQDLASAASASSHAGAMATARRVEQSALQVAVEQLSSPQERRGLRNRVENENPWGSLIDTIETNMEDVSTSSSSGSVSFAHDGSEPGLVQSAAERGIVEPDQLQRRLAELQQQLREVQGEDPLVLAVVDQQAVASVVADWTGIPVGRMETGQIDSVLGLEHALAEKVVGQDHAMRGLARRIHTSRAGLDDPEKPVGVFLLAGPSGVGKTETAIALAEMLFGGQQNLITINMSEFQESHTVSTLKGAPAGYVGYGEGGVLTEAVRRKPYSVVLLDEVEKAHPDTHEVFFQVFDKGRMEDGEGRSIDFKNTLILMTSNIGSETILQLNPSGDEREDIDRVSAAIRPDLLRVFPPALLGRMVVIPYYPLDDANLNKIIGLKIAKIVRRVRDTYAAEMVVPQSVLDLLRRRCTEVESGGRMIDAVLTNTLLPEISQRLLRGLSSKQVCRQISLSVVEEQIEYELS